MGPREAMSLHQAADFGDPAPTAGGFRWSGRAPVGVSGPRRGCVFGGEAGRVGPREAMSLRPAVGFGGFAPTAGSFR